MPKWTYTSLLAGRIRFAVAEKPSGDEPIELGNQGSKTLAPAMRASEAARSDNVALLRSPCSEDGPAVTALIAACPPLDTNSAYCNLVQCLHFADTCVVAEMDGRIVGWISGHRPPTAPEQFFVWQVAVDASTRGTGLAGRMLDHLVSRPTVQGAQMMTTTITKDNAASWALFGAFAKRHDAGLTKAPLFDRDRHFAGAHDTEWQATIGPLKLTKEDK